MQVNDIALVKECSTWNSMHGDLVIIDKVMGSSYSVSGLDGHGGGAWFTDFDLEFVRHGTDEERKDVDLKHMQVTAQQKDLNWIRDNWGKREGWSANSILTLFHEIGYNSSFERNGEYCILWDDWDALYPIFDSLMRNDIEEARNQIRKIIKPEYQSKYLDSTQNLYYKLNV